MKNLFFLLLICLTILSCSKDISKDNPKDISNEPVSYLDQWLGNYEGSSHHWSERHINGPNSPLITYNDTKHVFVNVQKSNIDSSLSFTFTYDSTIVHTLPDLTISSSGSHMSILGAGSDYFWRSVSFDSDSLYYDSFQKCGILCESGIDFRIRKK